ncbi:ectoine/hydroxyectoine ABC transporter substrate-binding protein EhuB [Dinoroseobacter sp. S375]
MISAVAACGLALPATADLLETAKGDGLKVAFFNFQPFSYNADGGELTGTDVDTLKAVLEDMGGSIDTAQATEWGALIPGLKAGRFDVVAAGMFVTPERCAVVSFSEPIFGIPQTLVVPADNPNGIATYDDIAEKGLKVAALSGSAQVGYARDSGIADANIMQIPDNPTAIAAVRAGRADAYALDAPGARALVAGVPEQDFIIVEPFGDIAGKPAMAHGAFAFRPEDQAFVDAFNVALKERIESGAHVATLEAHGMEATEMPKLTTAELCSE